jgi:hypothetical protein
MLRLMDASPPISMGTMFTMAEATPVGLSVESSARMGAMANTGPRPNMVMEKTRIKFSGPGVGA